MTLTDAILGREDRKPLKGLSWPAVPGHFGKPWFLPLVGQYYKALLQGARPHSVTIGKRKKPGGSVEALPPGFLLPRALAQPADMEGLQFQILLDAHLRAFAA